MKNNSGGRMVRIAGVLFWLMAMAHGSYGQVVWSFSAVKKSGSLVEVHVKASLSEGWHIYSTDTASSPFPTQVTVLPGPGFSLQGSLREEGRLIVAAQPDGGAPVRYFKGTVDFVRPVKIGGDLHSVSGTIQFVICTDEQCMPPGKKEFTVSW
jgi:hypothetical protein